MTPNLDNHPNRLPNRQRFHLHRPLDCNPSRWRLHRIYLVNLFMATRYAHNPLRQRHDARGASMVLGQWCVKRRYRGSTGAAD